ncbi:hypothetical protein KC332_g1191 [Hortaea werneckii]|uniref:Uncharacterized protein n=1 Tax=Hortaea werneckii EXF-2000 TaxID=1157616 RepID=A0A1Z5TCN9_HORWE|nr:hypothetical protein KC350_g5439 [Hortaea werneckii]OTA33631.1 hypothetical protein BTJ68_08202 [Hortaea werneckii EXF-2000]KAI6843277.1 hypothetical protein KC358_g3893 [Hortaea werneckii]KAI6936944.1 hypothetical protein KC341_g5903 [Hortaea werneckii]KAI6944031.1 hypothetical protein KC348_g4087 [Hortaea werneckii]
MATAQDSPTSDILRQVFAEYSSRLSIDGGSQLLVSDVPTALQIADLTKDIRTPYGPHITIATRGQDPSSSSSSPSSSVGSGHVPPTTSAVPEGLNCSFEPLDALTAKMDHFTHAVFIVNGTEDPKFVMQGFKWMHYTLRPKGVAVVVALKVESGKSEGSADGGGGDGGDGGGEQSGFTVGLEDKILYQTKGKAKGLGDVLEFAGFERGKIRSWEVETEGVFGGRKREGNVVLAMKWDQLTG